MTDDRLEQLLRTAIPPVKETEPRRDAWSCVLDRIGQAPRWSLVDMSLAAAAMIALLLNPEWLWLLAYHL